MSTRHDDELDVAGTLATIAGTVEPSADAWSRNIVLVRRRRHISQAAALVGAVAIAGATIGGIAGTRDHGQSAASSGLRGPRTGGGETSANLVGGPWAVAHYVRDGEPWIYYIGLGYERADSQHRLGVLSATQRYDVPATADMKWEQSVSLDPGYGPKRGRPVAWLEATDNPRLQTPQLLIGLTQPDVTEMTVLVRDKNASKSAPPKRVRASLYGSTRLKSRVFVAPFDSNTERIVSYAGRYSSGRTFNYSNS